VGDRKGRRWAMDLARRGALPAFKVGKDWFFHPRTVLVVLQRRAGVPAEAINVLSGKGN
jgi:hypothetical protein